LLAALLESAAVRTQLLVATRSVTLVNQLTPEEVWVVERQDASRWYEAMLFGDPRSVVTALNEPTKENELQEVRQHFAGPGEIEDGWQTLSRPCPEKAALRLSGRAVFPFLRRPTTCWSFFSGEG